MSKISDFEIRNYDLILFEDDTLGIVLDDLSGESRRKIYPGFNTYGKDIMSINRGGRMYVNDAHKNSIEKDEKRYTVKAICHNWWRRLTAPGIVDVVSSILMGFAHKDKNVLKLIGLTSLMNPCAGDVPTWIGFPKAKEMTIAEIEKELGYPVKIIKEK